MTIIKLTGKRQATLPKELCAEMSLEPGDAIAVDSQLVDGEKVWVLKPAREVEMPWFGALKEYSKDKPHDMRSIRQSVRAARRNGEA